MIDGLDVAGMQAATVSAEYPGRWDVWFKRGNGYQILEDWGHTPSDLLRDGWMRVATFTGGRAAIDITGTYREGRTYASLVPKEEERARANARPATGRGVAADAGG